MEMGDMDSFEWNKIAGAILGTFTFLMLVSFGGELLFVEKKTAQAGYELPMPAVAAVAGAVVVAAEPIAKRLVTAEVAKGENTFKQCATCHTPEKGGANKVGPNMWGIVERAKGQVAGFGYSAALKAVAAKGEKWTFDSLDKFLEGPRAYLPGTSMSYAGISNPKARADLIAYLNTITDSPVAVAK
jgi:cytochrome c